jgi:cytochrome P450
MSGSGCILRRFATVAVSHYPVSWSWLISPLVSAEKRPKANTRDHRYLQACIKEALRIFSPVPMGLARIAPEGGLAFGERTIPAGTIVSVSPWVIHYSKELWGQDADKFNPDRWLKGDVSAKEKYWVSVSSPHAL